MVGEVVAAVVVVVVVAVAEQDEVVEVRGAAVEPVPDVVSRALGGPGVAALDDAGAVAEDEGFELGCR